MQCLAGVAAVAFLAGVAALPQKAEQAAELPVISSTEAVPYSSIYGKGSTGNYLAGRYAANIGDFKYASRYLARTLHQEPENLELAGYAYRMYLITGEMDKALDMAIRLHEAGDEESNAEIMVLLSQVKNADYKAARETLERFERSGFNLVVLPLVEAWLDYSDGALTTPLEQNESLRRIAEFAPFIHYQTALINDIAGFEEQAIAQYNEALSLSRAMPYRVVEMLGNLYARRGEWDKVDALYTRYLEQNPDSVLMAVAPQPSADGVKPARLLHNAREGLAEIFFSTASILHNEKLNEEALIYIQQVLYLSPDFTAARLMRGTVHEELGRYDEALVEYAALPKTTPYYYKGQLRKAYALNAKGENEAALVQLGRLADAMPERYQVHLTRGDILMRDKQFGEAALAYSTALEQIGEYKAEHWPVFYARGISYERSDAWENAERDFLKALELEPGQPDVLNYLGYSWLTQNTRLSEAKNLIEQAVKARPTDAHIIDSMGWALYTTGDYAGAVEYLERAVALLPDDPTVNDHLGDAYWRMERRNEARFQWQRALMFKPEPDEAEKITAKLSDGLPTEDAVRTAELKEPSLKSAEVRHGEDVRRN